MPADARPFRFFVQGSRAPSAAGFLDLARRAEDLGYDGLTIADHLDDQIGPIAGLAAAAMATDRLLLGSMVFCNDYRHPALLAKEVATLDQLSGGRARLGLGAGWMTTDYTTAGIPLDRPGVRIARLEESVQICKALLAGGPVTFEGEHYRIDGLVGTPEPVQRPHPPILLGGGGEKVLRLAAREADVVAVNVALPHGVIDERVGPDATPEAVDRKIGWIREEAGDRFEQLTLQVRSHLTSVTDDRAGVADLVAGGLGLSPDDALGSPFALVGTVSELVDDLEARRQRWGFSEIGVSASALEEFAPVVAALSGR